MKYIDFEKHHYGFYVTYKNAKLHIELIENKKKVCDLTTILYESNIAAFNTGTAFVNVTKLDYAERLLAAAGYKPTGRTKTDVLGNKLVEYDFSALVKFNNREMKRNLIKRGMVDICPQLSISTSIVYYIYQQSKRDKIYRLVTTDSSSYVITEEFFVKAVRDFNIPVYKSRRKAPYEK